MKTVSVTVLSGKALDAMVAYWENAEFRTIDGVIEMKFTDTSWREWVKFSSDMKAAGDIVLREHISLKWIETDEPQGLWVASMPSHPHDVKPYYGETWVVAAMRCYVAFKEQYAEFVGVDESLVEGGAA